MSSKKKTDAQLLAEEQQKVDYAAVRKELLDGLLNAQPFAFDLNADALYRQYKDSYTRQGLDAAQNLFGKAATMTGGFGNSYAQSVAAQTYNDYMLSLQDKGLQIYENAYDRYQDDLDRKADLFRIADNLEQEEYDRAQDALKREDALEQKEYDRELDALKREDALEQKEYDREQDALKQSEESRQNTLSFAFKMAQLGDFSYLKELGMDITQLENAAKQESDAPEKISVSIQNTAQETYYTYGYAALVYYLNLQIAYGQITEKGKAQVLKALTGRV